MSDVLKYFLVFFVVFFCIGAYFGWQSNKYYKTDEFLKEAVYRNLSYAQDGDDDARLVLRCGSETSIEYDLKTKTFRSALGPPKQGEKQSQLVYVINENKGIATFILGGGSGWTVKEVMKSSLGSNKGDWRTWLAIVGGSITGGGLGYWLASSDPPACSSLAVEEHFKKLCADSTSFKKEALWRLINSYTLQDYKTDSVMLLLNYRQNRMDACLKKEKVRPQIIGSTASDSIKIGVSGEALKRSLMLTLNENKDIKGSLRRLREQGANTQPITYQDFITVYNYLEEGAANVRDGKCFDSKDFRLGLRSNLYGG